MSEPKRTAKQDSRQRLREHVRRLNQQVQELERRVALLELALLGVRRA